MVKPSALRHWFGGLIERGAAHKRFALASRVADGATISNVTGCERQKNRFGFALATVTKGGGWGRHLAPPFWNGRKFQIGQSGAVHSRMATSSCQQHSRHLALHASRGLATMGTRCQKKGRAYSRPKTGTWKRPRRYAFSTPHAGRASSAVLHLKFPGFVLDSSRSYAKCLFKKSVVRFVFLRMLATVAQAAARRQARREPFTGISNDWKSRRRHLPMVGIFGGVEFQ